MRLEKIFIFLLILLIDLKTLSGQNVDTIIHLSAFGKSLHFDHSFFDKVILIDNRPDTSLVMYVIRKKGHITPVRLDAPLSTAISAYIEEITRGTAKNGRTLLVELRRFEMTGFEPEIQPAKMHLFAKAYYNTGDSGFVQFVSLDTVFEGKNNYFHHERVFDFIKGKAIDVLLKEIDKKGDDNYPAQYGRVSLQEIQNNKVRNEWAKYPVNQANSYPTGVYEFYQWLRRNQIERFGLYLTMRKDSVYVINFTDSSGDDRHRVYNWLTMSRGQGFISFKGNLYFMLQYPLCLPVVKRNNTFYFHIPPPLPNLYYLNLAQEAGEEFSMEPTYSLMDLTFNILGFFASDARIKSIIKEGVNDPTMRDCYIDLDTGIFRYY